VGRRTDANFKALGQGEDGETETDASDVYLPLHPVHIFARGSARLRTRRSTLAASLLTTCDRLPSKPECKLQTGRGSGFTTYVTA
jgi:hypothetical protein